MENFNKTYYGIKRITKEGLEYFTHIYFHLKQTKFSTSKDEIYELQIEIHENQENLSKKNTSSEVNYIGWILKGRDYASLLFPSYVQFSCCFPYNHEILEKNGEGNAYRFKIIHSKLLE